MESFSCMLSNGATVTGISSIPPVSTELKERTPLIIGIHGGGYNSDYFHADTNYTAAIPSQAFGVPFVAFDRPYYGGTRPSEPLPSAADYPRETGTWVHRHILPALWSKFGHGCSGIVLLCHSLGCQQGIVAAALHTSETNPVYPLLGLIASGFGHRVSPVFAALPPLQANHGTDYFLQPAESKETAMFRPCTFDPSILKQTERLNHPIPIAEANTTRALWAANWRDQWAVRVSVPVMFAWAELDFFFEGTQEHLRECMMAFGGSPRVDGSWVKGAPHCMELSLWSRGWYARCFGFAMECAVAGSASVKGGL
jgi:pimeloyl-ACP methyl ester carboxylesterase